MKNAYTIFDNHCHTEFAYCSTDITVSDAVAKAKDAGMEYIAFTEHASHLYFENAVCWNSLSDPSFMKRANMLCPTRMEDYRNEIKKHSPCFAKTGFEVDVDRSGNLNLLPEDRQDAAMLVGGIHFLFSDREFSSCTAQKKEELFMRSNEALCKQGISVLAHPFRIFCRNNLPLPRHLYKPVARMLKSYRVAAELNFHYNNISDPAFFETCLEEGVKISPGTDSHCIEEVGVFDRHADFLESIGVSEENFKEIIFKLDCGRGVK
ncbi:MAG TPA: PHP domain-containing protein [bacterium]|nr:PHP domain-containing protein [bacterium]